MLHGAAPLWKEFGIECEIVATGPSIGPYADVMRSAGYRVHHLPVRKTPAYFNQYRRFIKSQQYDVVHHHSELAGYWFGLAALATGTKVLRTVHNNFAFEGNLRIRRALQRRHLASLGTQFVAIGTGVHENERQRFGIDCKLIWNWVDTTRFKPIAEQERIEARAAFGYGPQDLVAVVVGNCSAIKNHSALIQAVHTARGQLPNLRLLHLGVEDGEHSEQKLACDLGIQNHVHFEGWVADVRPALAAADIYVMPSLYEGMSIAAIEALAVGKPSIFAEVPGLKDLGTIFPNIIFSEPNDNALAEAIQTFARDDSVTRARKVEKYSEIALTKFSVNRGVREYSELYRELHSVKRQAAK